MQANYSPLRYPGGKGRLVDFIKSVIRENDLIGGTYIEPFSGGAAIALSLAIDGYMSRVVINDYDRSIYAFWHSILNHSDEFIGRIRHTQLTVEEWLQQREIQHQKETADLIDLGFSTFFLNRTNHSGVLKAGIIGGLQQTGKYKMDARYKKDNLIDRIKLIAEHKDKFILHNDDALDLIKRYRNIANKNLIYLDPPYYVKGRELYINFFKDKDHIELSQMIQQRQNLNWLITYDSHEFIHSLYSGNQSLEYDLPYSAGLAKRGAETLYCKQSLVLPAIAL